MYENDYKLAIYFFKRFVYFVTQIGKIMRISSINNTNNYVKQNNSISRNNNLLQQNKTYPMPTSAHYLSFMGGSSLDLKQSVANLERLETQDKAKFPPGIKETAHQVIESGNPDNKTLADIHKEKYALLEDCYDLEDVKSLFDEFKGVLSDADVDYRQDSFIAKVKKGEAENFNKDEDLALQLLKLYWAQGFSLTDLKEHAGTNLYRTMEKLNIPLMDRDYAHVLKFSDREYNEHLTSKMSQMQMEKADRLAQEKDGEPVYIKRGPLSEMHKKHISDGLIRHYAQHPEKYAQMSKRQKDYFNSNPQQKELIRNAMLYAWNKTQEGRSIKKHLVKFFKKANTKLDDNVLAGSQEDMTKEQQQIFSDFWKKNAWARELFSKALKKGWSAAKAQYNEFMQKLADFQVSCYAAAFVSTRNDIAQGFMPKGSYKNEVFLSKVLNCIDNLFYPDTLGVKIQEVEPKIVSGEEVGLLMKDIQVLSEYYNEDNFVEYINNKLKLSFKFLLESQSEKGHSEFLNFIGVNGV